MRRVPAVLVVLGVLALVVSVPLLRREARPPQEVVYSGSYVPLKGVTMTEAYRSSLDIRFDDPEATGHRVRDAGAAAVLVGVTWLLVRRHRRRAPGPVTGG